jgi:hypothetical protein
LLAEFVSVDPIAISQEILYLVRCQRGRLRRFAVRSTPLSDGPPR